MLAAIVPSVAYSQLVADFDIVQNDNCSPAQITFINNSTGQTQSEWDFGDGTIVTNNEPVILHVYLNSGEFTVTLHVSNGSEDDDISHDLTISDGPEADFGADYTNGCIGGDIHFSDASVAGDAEIVNWSWDFRNGILRNGQDQTVSFSSEGSYDILLTVTDANNCTDFIEKVDYVNIVEQPLVNFDPVATDLCSAPATVNFTNATSSSLPLDYTWDYGNGDTGDSQNGQTIYTEYNDYTVVLTGSSGGGCYGQHTEEISIREEFTAAFDVYQSGSEIPDGGTICPGEIILINQTGSGPDMVFEFPGGSSRTGDTITYVVTESGEFTVNLRSEFPNQCIAPVTRTFYVDDVHADFEIASDITCNFPLNVQFNNLSENASVYNWTLAQGNTSSSENPQVVIENIYAESDYIVDNNIYYYENRLVVVSPEGCRDTMVKNLEFVHPVAEDMYVSVNRGCVPLEVEFADKSISAGISQRNWIFGDGSSVAASTLTRVTHTYATAGEYNAFLVLTDNKNCKDTSDIFYIEAGDVLQPDFTFTPNKLCYNDTLQFTDLTPDNHLIDAWHYQSSANIHIVCEDEPDPQAAIHATAIGNHDISLTVDYNGCFSSITKPDAIYVRGPVASFRDSSVCEDPLTYYFKGDIVQATDITYEFGDLTSVIDFVNTDHTYAADGDYNIILTTYNDTTGCTHVYEREVYPRTVFASFTMDASDVCVGDGHTYDASASTGYNDNCFDHGFAWFFDDTLVPHLTYLPTFEYGFSRVGTFDITLVVEDVNGCRDSAFAVVRAHQPEALFETDKNSGCVPAMDIIFENTSTDSTIVSWRFFFGDGNYVWDQSTYTYTYFSDISRSYHAGITVYDAYGCVDNLYKELNIWKPSAAFSASETDICVGDEVTFNPDDTNYDHAYWKFGTGTFAEVPGIYTFNDRGNFDVGLIVEKDECRDTSLRVNYISVQDADASFYASDTITDCYPQIITFTHTNSADPVSTGYWDFDFGGNTSGTYVNPVSFAYSAPGTYHPTLHMATSNGCTDEKSIEVTVNGPYAEIAVSDAMPCIGDTITFSMTDVQDVYDFEWVFDDGNSSKLSPVQHAYEEVNDYTVSLIIADINGCVPPYITREIMVRDAYAEFDIADGIYMFCLGEPVTIINSSVGDDFEWRVNNEIISTLWNPGDVSVFFTPGESYLIMNVWDGPACHDADSVRLRINPIPLLTTGTDTVICGGEIIGLEAFVDEAEAVQWEPSAQIENATTLNPSVQPEVTTTYYVYVSNDFGCGTHDSVTVYVQEFPEITRDPLSDTSIIYLGDEITLMVGSSNASSYVWSPGSYLSCDQCDVTIARPDKSITYTATISDNCYVNTERFIVYVIDPYTIAVPDVFTPNGDGMNDIIYVRGQGIGELIEFKIFNRWGNLVYSSNNIDEGWDGYYKGKLQNTDIYTYSIKIRTERGREVEQKGTFHLIH